MLGANWDDSIGKGLGGGQVDGGTRRFLGGRARLVGNGRFVG